MPCRPYLEALDRPQVLPAKTISPSGGGRGGACTVDRAEREPADYPIAKVVADCCYHVATTPFRSRVIHRHHGSGVSIPSAGQLTVTRTVG